MSGIPINTINNMQANIGLAFIIIIFIILWNVYICFKLIDLKKYTRILMDSIITVGKIQDTYNRSRLINSIQSEEYHKNDKQK